jgi:hypothetical protein
MTAAWRLLDYSFTDPFMNLAMEESILRGRVEGESPDTLRLWQHPPVVSIGCFLNPEDEINVDPCKMLSVIHSRVSNKVALSSDRRITLPQWFVNFVCLIVALGRPPGTLPTSWNAGFVGIGWITEDFTKNGAQQRERTVVLGIRKVPLQGFS